MLGVWPLLDISNFVPADMILADEALKLRLNTNLYCHLQRLEILIYAKLLAEVGSAETAVIPVGATTLQNANQPAVFQDNLALQTRNVQTEAFALDKSEVAMESTGVAKPQPELLLL